MAKVAIFIKSRGTGDQLTTAVNVAIPIAVTSSLFLGRTGTIDFIFTGNRISTTGCTELGHTSISTTKKSGITGSQLTATVCICTTVTVASPHFLGRSCITDFIFTGNCISTARCTKLRFATVSTFVISRGTGDQLTISAVV